MTAFIIIIVVLGIIGFALKANGEAIAPQTVQPSNRQPENTPIIKEVWKSKPSTIIASHNEGSLPKNMTALKSELATSLMIKGKVTIDGMEVNLWQGHTAHTFANQMTWNKIKSYTELNAHSEGENGHLVFTGVMQIKREEAAAYAVKMGFKVHQQVSPHTDFVIIGSENVSPSKIAAVIQLNEEHGTNIKVIDELTFLSLISEHLIDKNYALSNS